ncbi:hypothetical protein JZ751_026441 [Albula glossodonta]|uniref:ST8 alpha-N-acetyl-neuraminide alpha-2,8-sialyltransferase 6 n=1 Tax=Albula glossodonta TaxID=121402 RepID=A0A8T2PKM9_9TELE|nr:hypothetical protein JZ751_026441 [Albula glossodonta]
MSGDQAVNLNLNGCKKTVEPLAPSGMDCIGRDEESAAEHVYSSLLVVRCDSQLLVHLQEKTCAVVGNGGILTNSSCGEDIDSAQFIFRFAGLMERRHPFVENLNSYGNSFLLLPAFSYSRNIDVSLRAVYTLQDFQTPAQPIFLNPKYLKSLTQFWRARGLKAERLSTGVMMASLALELCTNVNLYGFWPFPLHPYSKHPLSNHYYDDQQGKNVHNMSAEFEQLLRLHEQGVVRVHLGKCTSGPR